MKKMTLKEFKEALENELGMHFDVWGWDGIFNELIIARQHSALTALNEFGSQRVYDYEMKHVEKASEYLRKRGYYDNL